MYICMYTVFAETTSTQFFYTEYNTIKDICATASRVRAQVTLPKKKYFSVSCVPLCILLFVKHKKNEKKKKT